MVVKNVKSTHTVTHTHTLGERGRSGGGLPAPAPPHIHTQKHSTKEPNVAAMYTAVDILLSQNKARRQPSNSVLHCVHCDNPYCHPGPRTSAAHERTLPYNKGRFTCCSWENLPYNKLLPRTSPIQHVKLRQTATLGCLLVLAKKFLEQLQCIKFFEIKPLHDLFRGRNELSKNLGENLDKFRFSFTKIFADCVT